VTPVAPTITSAVYDAGTGQVLVGASEAVILVNASAAPWSVTFDALPQAIAAVSQAGDDIRLTTTSGGGGSIELSYAGGTYVEGAASGLPLEAVSRFPVST
jgi:hypothetical protein